MTDGAALQITQKFEVIYCYSCKIPFAVPADVRRRWVENGGTFWCPNGHNQHYTESDVQKLRKQLEEANRSRDWYKQRQADERAARERTERRLIATKGAKTRLRNRIKNGVCPCCNRTFIDLQRHMASRHPGFQPDEPESST